MKYSVMSRQTLVILMMAVPAIVFMGAVIRYSVNIPYYDDITQVLWIMNTFIEGATDAGTPPHIYAVDGRLHAIFYPNAGHVPMVTRLFALIQYAMGGVNFYYATIVACGFWVVAVLFLVRHLRTEDLPLYALLPLPFLFFSLAQWEAMATMLGGIQVYIGTLFLPLLALWCLTQRRILFAGIIFFFALFASSGSLALLPLGIAYLVLQREWKAAVIFLVITLPSVVVFKHLNVFAVDPFTLTINVRAIVDFFLIFMGNIISNGSANLGPLHEIHWYSGIAMFVCGALGFFACPKQHLAKLIFVYVLMLASMTAIQRGSEGGYIAPRYAAYSLFALGAVYILLAASLRKYLPKTAIAFIVLATIASMLMWGDSVMRDSKPLAFYKGDRIAKMQNYIKSGDASLIMWDLPWCDDILTKAKKLHVYDYTAEENFR